MAPTRHKLACFKQVSPKSTNVSRRCFQSRRKRESKQVLRMLLMVVIVSICCQSQGMHHQEWQMSKLHVREDELESKSSVWRQLQRKCWRITKPQLIIFSPQSTMGILSTNLNMCNCVWKTVLGHWNGANVMHLFTTHKEVDQYNNAKSLKHCQQPIALVETDH